MHPKPAIPLIWRLVRGLLLVIADFYAFAMSSYLVVRVLSGQRYWPIELGNNFLHWLLLPSLFLLPLMLFLRRWQWSILHTAPFAGFAILYGILFLPQFPTPCSGCARLRVMTYNLLGHDLPNYDYTAQMSLIRESGADLIALQELSSPAAAAIETQLSNVYPHQALYPDGTAGIGLLSKFPIITNSGFQIPPSNHYNLRAVVDFNGVPITVISAHPPPPGFDIRYGYGNNGHPQMLALANELDTTDGPILFMGDLNMVDQTDDYRLLLAAGLLDTHREVGWGFGVTWPTWWDQTDPFPPLLRLDYIFHSSHFSAVNTWVSRTILSDHKPVLADLRYNP